MASLLTLGTPFFDTSLLNAPFNAAFGVVFGDNVGDGDSHDEKSDLNIVFILTKFSENRYNREF
ncbi:hypothetical protein B0181_04065 [Moraxella caviae]|uniref:Uncharacterized protein n=1 Tax=Moraxella caviae TaxID=34060 RepID=A0A1T0A540_9GAMM|nr:hypothetical protein B0181_04065 [Moraxella caviae]